MIVKAVLQVTKIQESQRLQFWKSMSVFYDILNSKLIIANQTLSFVTAVLTISSFYLLISVSAYWSLSFSSSKSKRRFYFNFFSPSEMMEILRVSAIFLSIIRCVRRLFLQFYFSLSNHNLPTFRLVEFLTLLAKLIHYHCIGFQFLCDDR